jgi:hypothetical protein
MKAMSPKASGSAPLAIQSERGRRVIAGVAIAALLGLGLAAAPFAGEPSRYPTNLELVRKVTSEAVTEMLGDLPPAGRRVRIQVEPFHEAGWLVEDLVGQDLRARGYEVVVVPTTPVSPPPGAGTTPPVAPQAAGDQAYMPPSGAAQAGAAAQSAMQQSGQEPPPAESAPAAGDSASASAPGDELGSAAGDGTGLASGSGSPEKVTAGGAAQSATEAPSAAELLPVDGEIELRVIELGLRYTKTHKSGFIFGGTKVERLAAASLHADLRSDDGAIVRWSGLGESSAIDEVPKDELLILEGQRYPFTAPALPQKSSTRWVEPVIVSVIVVGLVFLFVSNRS